MVPYDDLFNMLRNFIFYLPIWAANYRDIICWRRTQKRYITEINISQVSGGMVVCCCLKSCLNVFWYHLWAKVLLFHEMKLSLETLYETVLMMIRKIFHHKQTIKSEVTIYKNWLSSRNKTSYVRCIWRRSAGLDVEIYVSRLLNLKIQTIS